VAGDFTKKYSVHDPVWYKIHGTMKSVIVREKQMKAWK
jgi:predicted GIY-YIG superfamily endonuclease